MGILKSQLLYDTQRYVPLRKNSFKKCIVYEVNEVYCEFVSII